jgi:hypothetical protein
MHTTLRILPDKGFLAGTPNPQFLTCSKPGPPARAGIVPSHVAQVYHTLFLALGNQTAAHISGVVFLHAPPLASSAWLKPAVSARRFL